MKKIHLYTTIAVVFVLTGIALMPSDFPFLASLYGTVAYLFAMKEVSKYTSWYQFSVALIAAAFVGLTVAPTLESTILYVFCGLIIALGSLLRIILFRFFQYTQYSWFEPSALALGLALYLMCNFIYPGGWASWVFLLIMLIFHGVLTYGIMKDKIQLTEHTKGGYKIAIGKGAPEFALPDQDGKIVCLSDFSGVRNLLLIFVRGDWCPGCHMMLRTYERERLKFQQKNILVMAIGPDPVGVNREMVEKLGLDFKVLADEGQQTAMKYGVQLSEYDNDFAEKYEEGIPLPASFLIDKKGIVQYVSRPDKIGEFLDPRTIFPILDKLNY